MRIARRLLATLTVGAVALGGAAVTHADTPAFAGPLFGLNSTPSGKLLVADAGAGVWELDKGKWSLAVALPAVSDAAAQGNGQYFVLQTGLGEPTDPEAGGRILYRVTGGNVRALADIGAFEEAHDPDGKGFDSNPYDLAVVSANEILVVDAGGNSLLRVNARGHVELIATFPEQPAPNPFGPGELSAEAVPTSVAIGPDGAYYVGELTGFPGTPGLSRVWRVERGTTGAACGTDSRCTVVGTGFTSIIDLAFGKDGTLYVAELDEASWFAVEVLGTPIGGTINACTLGATLTCVERATDLMLLTAVTEAKGQLYATVNALNPAAAEVIAVP